MKVAKSTSEPFGDGVKYTMREALYLSASRASVEDLKAIHIVKSIFDGEIILPENMEIIKYDIHLD